MRNLRKVDAPDGRTWWVSMRRAGVPDPGASLQAVLWLIGWGYHVLFRYGRWRVEAVAQPRRRLLSSKFPTTWVFGEFPEKQARDVMARVIAHIEAGTQTFDPPT